MKGSNSLTSLLIFFFLTFFVSCSNISFYNDSDITIHAASPKSEKQQNFIVEFNTETLLWGMVPLENKLDLYHNINLETYQRVGNLSIKIFQTRFQKFLTITSFGIYIPETIQYNFWGEYKLSE